MSKEIISRGNPFEIEHVGREFGGAREMAFRVDDEDGTVEIAGIPASGPFQVHRVVKKLTSAQILALDGTPVQVIAKPAPGEYIEVISVHAFLDYGGTAYAAVAGTDYLQLRYTDGSGAKHLVDVDPSSFATATADAYLNIGPATSLVPLNAKVVASLAGPWTTGNSPITLEIFYRVRKLAV